jgi:TPR repeat protein
MVTPDDARFPAVHSACRKILSLIIPPVPMRRLILGAAIAAGLAAPAFAGLEDGLAAYDQGDYATAYRELAAAAAGGAPAAQYALARMYLSGEGVSRDSATGMKWLREAATAGVGPAQYQLGVSYELGIITPQDYGKAARWYRIAADHDVPLAQYRLGLLYLNGLGVAADLIAAHMWLNLAAARLPPGEPRNAVANVREAVASKMTVSQIAQAQKAAHDWAPREGRSSDAVLTPPR